MPKNIKKYALLGYPLSHSFSKKYFEEKFLAENISDTSFETLELKSLRDFKIKLNDIEGLKGLSVTIPFKQQIIAHLDSVDPIIRKIGAVNCVKIIRNGEQIQLKGFNTDIDGFDKSLSPLLDDHHQKALILGTGGAALAVAYVLDQLSIKYTFVSRNPNACKQIRYSILNESIMQEHKLIINTTPLGMYPETNNSPDIPYQYLGRQHLLFDLIYNPAKTQFLKKGEKMGALIKNGYEMLKIQADKAWEIWNT